VSGPSHSTHSAIHPIRETTRMGAPVPDEFYDFPS
jgi:hypothetical protein